MDRQNPKGEKSGSATEVVLNCGVNGCCPTFRRIDSGTFELVADDGQKVVLSLAQVEHLQRALPEIIGA